MVQCVRCGGSGKTAWKHVEDGVCFLCGGTGKMELRDAPEVKSRGWKLAVSHEDAVRKLRILYRNAKKYGSTLEEMHEGATGVVGLLEMAPEIKPHFRALGWAV